MNCFSKIVLCALALPGTALAATRTYEVGGFEEVSVSAGISADIRTGAGWSVVAETSAGDFDHLKVEVRGKELRIGRPARRWFFFGPRPRYQVHVVTPALRSVESSSGAEVQVQGTVQGDLRASASSGSELEVASLKGGTVKASASSGSDLSIAGSCVSLEAEVSSGADLDAGGLHCETVRVQASSGSDASVFASKGVSGSASSGSDVSVAGAPPLVQVEKSSGGDVDVRR